VDERAAYPLHLGILWSVSGAGTTRTGWFGVRRRVCGWRGGADMGTGADGGTVSCITVSGNQRCAGVTWRQQAYAFIQNPADTLGGWYGTLLSAKEDATGTMYRRNRYLDPATGRFTQEDPIGLAGGLNLYGFAGGDPVNSEDPFGLCPWTGQTRDRNLNDCPKDAKGNEDKRTTSFRLLMADSGPKGNQTVDYVIQQGVNVQLMNGIGECGPDYEGCSSKRDNWMKLNGARSPSTVAALAVHEVTHLAVPNPCNGCRNEAIAWIRSVDFYSRLPKKLQTASDYNGALHDMRLVGRKVWFNAQCTGQWSGKVCPP
jgi:RHS repeat-associated protein